MVLFLKYLYIFVSHRAVSLPTPSHLVPCALVLIATSYYRLFSELSQLESEKCALGCIFMLIENPSNLPSVVVEAKTQIFYDTNCLVRCYTPF